MDQSWCCSQIEDESEERDAMDRLQDDEMMRQWEEVSKEEEKITLRRGEGRRIKMQKGPKCAGTNGVTGADEDEGGKEGEGKEEGGRLRSSFVAQAYETNSLKRRNASFGGGRKGYQAFNRCEKEKRKEWREHLQCNTELQELEDKPWRNES